MKQLKMLGLAAIAAAALTAFTAAGAAATALEVGGVGRNESVTISGSLNSGTSANLKDTFGLSINTCTESSAGGKTSSPYTGTTVTGQIETLTFNKCTRGPVVVHDAGKLHIEHIKGTTDGTVSSSIAEVTMPLPPYGNINCKTGENTHLGTLKGVKEGHATLEINATLFCSGISSKWVATYTVTSPTGLGVTDSVSSATLEVGGEAKNESVSVSASLKSGTSAILKDTFGFASNTCTESTAEGKTSSPYTGTTVTGQIETLTFGKCTREPVVVHKAGTLHISHIAGTTNGTVTSSGAEVTTGSPFGTLNCKTEGTHLGTLTGVKEGHATIDINATLSCGISSKWTATYTVTTPTGLGVSA